MSSLLCYPCYVWIQEVRGRLKMINSFNYVLQIYNYSYNYLCVFVITIYHLLAILHFQFGTSWYSLFHCIRSFCRMIVNGLVLFLIVIVFESSMMSWCSWDSQNSLYAVVLMKNMNRKRKNILFGFLEYFFLIPLILVSCYLNFYGDNELCLA